MLGVLLLILFLGAVLFVAALGVVLAVGALAGLVWLLATGVGRWRRGHRAAGVRRILLALTLAGVWTALAYSYA